MDYQALLESAVEFSSDGIGAVMLKVAEFFYTILYPSNADPATILPKVDPSAAIQTAVENL
jgi:hypothetical protein